MHYIGEWSSKCLSVVALVALFQKSHCSYLLLGDAGAFNFLRHYCMKIEMKIMNFVLMYDFNKSECLIILKRECNESLVRIVGKEMNLL